MTERHEHVNRRDMLRRTVAGVGAWTVLRPLTVFASTAPRHEILQTRVISQTPQYYHGWPTLARLRDGQLVVVYSGGREAHVCPFGRVEMMRSRDEGMTWSWPRVLIDGAIDDRDAGILETPRGTLLVTTFSSNAYERMLTKAQAAVGTEAAWEPSRLKAWEAVHHRVDADGRAAALDEWMIRSEDGGVSWSAPYHPIVNSPHGPIALADGRLLYAGKTLWDSPRRAGVCVSEDDGRSWQWLAEISPREGDDPAAYHELHAVEAPSGKIVVHIRNHNREHDRETLQCHSTDGGRTWSTPRSIGVWGLPSFLTRLGDGRLVMTYGHRRPPYGNQARVSDDEGATWSEAIAITEDGSGVDLGYPSTVQLPDGDLITVWYERMSDSSKAVLRLARWRLL